MIANLTIDVGALDAPYRRALEDVIGRPLSADERVLPARLQFCFWRPAGAGRPAGARLKLAGMGRRELSQPG